MSMSNVLRLKDSEEVSSYVTVLLYGFSRGSSISISDLPFEHDTKRASSKRRGNELDIVFISSSPIPSSAVSCCVGRDSRYGREGFFQCPPFVLNNHFQRGWSSATVRHR